MLLVIGGQCSKAGKTAVACAILGALRHWNWTAVKLSPHAHAAAGGIADAPLSRVVVEEKSAASGDSGRFLHSGAARAFLLCYRRGRLEESLPALDPILQSADNVLVESNEFVRWVEPDLFLFVANPSRKEWKPSARQVLPKAGALVIAGPGELPDGLSVPPSLPRFRVRPPAYWNAQLADFIASRAR